ncbi:hypothetical protein BGZ47_004744, partial [Haplosporangium gracile]
LHWMTYYAIKHRAKIELARALYKDQRRREACTTGAALQLFSENPDHHFDKMKTKWEVAPHIVMAKEGVTFGEMWDTLPEGGAEEEEE